MTQCDKCNGVHPEGIVQGYIVDKGEYTTEEKLCGMCVDKSLIVMRLDENI